MAYSNGRHSPTHKQVPPIVAELEAIFKALPDKQLIEQLQKSPNQRGPKGYSPAVLWRCFVAFYCLSLPSVSDLIRTLHDNPYIARVCGISNEASIPSQPTFSRFFARMAKRDMALAVRNVHRELTRICYETLPDFGKRVAIDSTDVKAWSHGKRKATNKTSDKDAGWCVKHNTEGNIKWVWGYKVHLVADTKYELPIAFAVTAGNVADVSKAAAVLGQAKQYTGYKFKPDYVIADAGYSSEKLRHFIRQQCWSKPIILPNKHHKKAVAREPMVGERSVIYKDRTSIERLNARLKAFCRLDKLRVRGNMKVKVHTTLALIACQARAIATGCRASVRKVA